jgi:hypothetical protein
MIITKAEAPKVFTPVSVTFNNEAEFHDVLAALIAYSRKESHISGSSIASDNGLTAYSGNCRATVKNVLPKLTAVL